MCVKFDLTLNITLDLNDLFVIQVHSWCVRPADTAMVLGCLLSSRALSAKGKDSRYVLETEIIVITGT